MGLPIPSGGPFYFSALLRSAVDDDRCSLCRVSVPIVCGAAPLKSVIYVLQQYFSVPIVCSPGSFVSGPWSCSLGEWARESGEVFALLLSRSPALSLCLMCPDCLMCLSFEISHLRPATIFWCPDCLLAALLFPGGLMVLAPRSRSRVHTDLLRCASAAARSRVYSGDMLTYWQWYEWAGTRCGSTENG